LTATVLVDSDTLSEIARGHARITAAARRYLELHGRLTFSAVTVFERLRGYRSAMARGRPFELHMRRFVALCEQSVVLPLDVRAADHAAMIWGAVGARARAATMDLLIVATASAHGLALVTRNVRDFAPLVRAAPRTVPLVDWAAR
jgi:predicted nucleic acid-binding protein